MIINKNEFYKYVEDNIIWAVKFKFVYVPASVEDLLPKHEIKLDSIIINNIGVNKISELINNDDYIFVINNDGYEFIN